MSEDRYRKALEDIIRAECCGCAIYSQIARAALNGKAWNLSESGRWVDVEKDPPAPCEHRSRQWRRLGGPGGHYVCSGCGQSWDLVSANT